MPTERSCRKLTSPLPSGVGWGDTVERVNQTTSCAPETPTAHTLAVRLLDDAATLPVYQHADDAGADLATIEDVTLAPFERRLVRTGVSIALQPGTVGLIHPRSGLAVKHGLTVLNAPGTIDAGYRGELKVPLINLDPNLPITLTKGDRIAQLVIQHVVHATFVNHQGELPAALSQRSEHGFGSTGGHGAHPV